MDAVTVLKFVNDKLLDAIQAVEEDAAKPETTEAEKHDLEVAQDTYVTVIKFIQELIEAVDECENVEESNEQV